MDDEETFSPPSANAGASLKRRLDDVGSEDGSQQKEKDSKKPKKKSNEAETAPDKEIQLSGSEEYLLGFSEGEAEVVATEISSPPVKALKQTTAVTVPAKRNTSVSKTAVTDSMKEKSVKSLKQTRSPVAKATAATDTLKQNSKNMPKKQQHIVGDTEEIKGVKKSSKKREASPETLINKNESEFYRKPFEYGWKRELVWRNNMQSKVKADVYFISPGGKKLRNRSDIVPLLEGDLTIEHFSFARHVLGVGANFELVRNAKLPNGTPVTTEQQTKTLAMSPVGKRVSKSKPSTPILEKSPPTRVLKALNATVLKNSDRNTCITTCSRGPEVPKLKCVKCSYAFHHECVTISKGREYICESCMLEASSARNTLQSVTTLSADSKLPQTIGVVKGKKYVVVSKPVEITSTENVSENNLNHIKESIRKIGKRPNASAAIQSQKASSNTITTVDHSNRIFATNFFTNISFAYDTLLCVFKYLKIHERPVAASVCKLWNLASKDTSLWNIVRMKNSKVLNWYGFATALRSNETKHLDLRKMLIPNTRADDMWQKFSTNIGLVYSLEIIDLCRCTARIVENLFSSNTSLRVINAVAINDVAINLEQIHLLKNLEELRLRACKPATLVSDLKPLESLTRLKHLSLTGLHDLGNKCIQSIASLTQLQSLELGDCNIFDSIFASDVLPQLIHLRRLRLENGQEGSCCSTLILGSVASLPQLSQIELINFDIKPGFDTKLKECINIQKLLIIPTYVSQSATTNQIMLSAVQNIADTLQCFTWGVTLELLRVTALYVDQCEESKKKEKNAFDECIPVLKPVPGATLVDIEDENEDILVKAQPIDEKTEDDAVPQIEILPLEKIKLILDKNLPQTKVTIVKLPYQSACKQQMVM